jgi:ribose transport system permease protein
MTMNRIFGVLSLLGVMYALLFMADFQNATKWSNLKDVLGQQAFFGILTLGVGILIITGGIDLSIGSVVGLSAVLFGVLMRNGVSPWTSMIIVLMTGILIGLFHATLVTMLKLQPFLVTLCGLFIYRGAARMLSPGRPVGLQTSLNDLQKDKAKELMEAGLSRTEAETLASAYQQSFAEPLETMRLALVGKNLDGELGFPMQAIVLVILAALAVVLVHRSVWGRYWYAIGQNEQAAKYAGVRTGRQKFAVYVLSSTLASFGGILMLLDYSTASPESAGETWELYAITGAVLGGCSLRGGEGSVPGMILGAAVLPLLKNLISFVGNIPWVLERVKIDPVIPALVGFTLLIGTIIDEFFRRRSKVRG